MLETSLLSPLTHSLGSPTQGLVPPTVVDHSPHWCNQNSLPLASLDVHPLADPLTNWQSVLVITAPPRDITVLPPQTLCFRDSFLFAHQIYHLFFSSTWCLVRQKNGFGLCLEFVRKSELWEVSPWSALLSCLLSSFKVVWTIWGSCHLVTDFVFWCSSAEQYWGVVVKQRNSSPGQWIRKLEKALGANSKSRTSEIGSPALTLLSQRLQGDMVGYSCLRFASYLLWPV